jgi:hypothetical protein
MTRVDMLIYLQRIRDSPFLILSKEEREIISFLQGILHDSPLKTSMDASFKVPASSSLAVTIPFDTI